MVASCLVLEQLNEYQYFRVKRIPRNGVQYLNSISATNSMVTFARATRLYYVLVIMLCFSFTNVSYQALVFELAFCIPRTHAIRSSINPQRFT
jgi:hypothetical protein